MSHFSGYKPTEQPGNQHGSFEPSVLVNGNLLHENGNNNDSSSTSSIEPQKVRTRGICPITGRQARYFDPLTQTPYFSLNEFAIIRMKYIDYLRTLDHLKDHPQMKKLIANNPVKSFKYYLPQRHVTSSSSLLSNHPTQTQVLNVKVHPPNTFGINRFHQTNIINNSSTRTTTVRLPFIQPINRTGTVRYIISNPRYQIVTVRSSPALNRPNNTTNFNVLSTNYRRSSPIITVQTSQLPQLSTLTTPLSHSSSPSSPTIPTTTTTSISSQPNPN